MRVRLLLLSTVLFFGCPSTPPSRAEPKDAGPAQIVLWDVLQLRAPLDARANSRPDRLELILRPETRSPSTLTLQRCTQEEDAALRREATANVGPLAYRLERHEGGSGGAEASLLGAYTLGKQSWKVECHVQSEFPLPAGDWCLPYLLTLEPR